MFTGAKTTTGQTNWSISGTSGAQCNVPSPSGSSPFADASLSCDPEGSGYYYVTVIKGPCSSSTIYGTFNQNPGKSGSFTCGWTNNSYTWP